MWEIPLAQAYHEISKVGKLKQTDVVEIGQKKHARHRCYPLQFSGCSECCSILLGHITSLRDHEITVVGLKYVI